MTTVEILSFFCNSICLMLRNKKILIGITGSIAAYKIITLTRLLIKEGAEVKVILTKAAIDFVPPLVLSTLTRNPVLLDLSINDEWSNHVQLGRWADLFLIAPLTCNTLAKMATGICDNLLLATYYSAICPIILAPAMDEDMWKHPATINNIKIVKGFGNTVLSVNNGELASGLIGEGRMSEPEEIFQYINNSFTKSCSLKGKCVMVTAGPTFEAIDPVRFIGNYSSGKMGFSIAEEFYLQGANVTLITGPTHEVLSTSAIKRIDVVSASQMYQIGMEVSFKSDIIVMSAAVADYTPINISKSKIKKAESEWTLSLTKTKDILATIGQVKRDNQFLLGFALETNNEIENALIKLKKKNADCIVLNSLNDNNAGFGFETNKITILQKSGDTIEFDLKSKKEVAKDIVSYIISQIDAK